MNTDSSSAASLRQRADRTLYICGALAAVVIVFAGFARTYYLKGLFGTPELSPLVHAHGIVMTLWFLLFLVQVWLVSIRRVAVHRTLGILGGLVAVLVLGVGTTTAITAASLGHSPGPPPLVFLTIPLGDMIVFATLVTLGLSWRRSPDIHRRLMLLSSLGILTAAIARIPLDIVAKGGLPLYFALTDVIIIIAVVVDVVRNRRLHPAFGWGLAFIVASQVFRFAIAGTPAWLRFAEWLTK